MKDIYYFFVFVLSLFFAACDSSILENEVASPIKVEKEITPKTWQEQVDFAKNHANVMTKLNINQVKFVRHTYLGKINTEKQIANLWLDLFADEVEMVVYPHGNITDYEIVPLKEVREKYQTLEMDKYIEFLKGQLDPVVKIGTELIELEWEYKGKAVHSLGIISNGKIVYDHIGSMIVIQGDMSQDFDVYSSIKPIKTRTEEVGMYERSWEISNKGGSSYLGEYSWKYDIRCHAFFNSNGILVNFTTYAKGILDLDGVVKRKRNKPEERLAYRIIVNLHGDTLIGLVLQ